MRLLTEQLDWHWTVQLRPRLEGLSDEEYLWEPVAGAWSIRPRHEATSANAAGAGDYVADFQFPEPSPPPFTTVAWRLAHLYVGIFGVRAASHFGAEPISYATADYPPTAAGALALLDRKYDAWLDGVRALSEPDLWRPVGPAEGPWADHPMFELILHINREAIHHGAEVALLRDLYLHQNGAG